MKLLQESCLSLTILCLIEQLGEAYGYQLREAIHTKTGGQYMLQEGTLYPLLRQHTEKGFIEGEWKVGQRGPARRYYRLTPAGREFLQHEKTYLMLLLG